MAYYTIKKQLMTGFTNLSHPNVTFSGTSVTSAIITTAGWAYYRSSVFSIKTGESIIVEFPLYLISGTLRVFGIIPTSGGGWQSNYVSMSNGHNYGLLTATSDVASAAVWFEGNEVSNYSTGPVSIRTSNNVLYAMYNTMWQSRPLNNDSIEIIYD